MNKTKYTLFGSLSKFSYNTRAKIVGIAVLLPILIMIAIVWFGYDDVMRERDGYEKIVNDMKEAKHALVTTAILDNCKRAKLQTDNSKTNIVIKLYDTYGTDTYRMKDDFLSQRNDTPFYTILSEEIKDKYLNVANDNNRMYIATKDGVLMDNSINYTYNTLRSWEDIAKDTPNVSMVNDAIASINSNKLSQIIFWIDDKSVVMNKTHYIQSIMYDEYDTTFNFIRKFVMEDKMEELMQYNILVVSYIFDTKDIFGISDVDYGIANDNNKLYIIQTFNIRDMISSNRYLENSLGEYDAMIERQTLNTSNSIDISTKAIIILLLLEAMSFLGVWYMAEFFIYFYTPEASELKKLK